jgi:hypothetical protein
MYSVSLSWVTKPVPGRGVRWISRRSTGHALSVIKVLMIILIGQIEANTAERDYSTGNPSSLDRPFQQQSARSPFLSMRPTR